MIPEGSNSGVYLMGEYEVQILSSFGKADDKLGPGDCGHGVRGCTSCTRACPRFRTWETEIDEYLFGHERAPDDMAGVSKDIISP